MTADKQSKIILPDSPEIVLPEKKEIVLPEFTSDFSGLQGYEFFVRPDEHDLTNRQYEEWMRWVRLVQWGRKNPIQFCEEIFGIEFMDYQKYAFGMSWDTPNVVWCMSRNGGKSLLGSIFVMAKTLLIPNHKSYILCGVGSQAIEMFLKIEQITKRSLSSFTTLTDIFDSELVKSNSNSSGFVHNPASYTFSLFNASQVFTLNGAYDNNRSPIAILAYITYKK